VLLSEVIEHCVSGGENRLPRLVIVVFWSEADFTTFVEVARRMGLSEVPG